MKKVLYLALSIIGSIVPYIFLIQFLQNNGLNFSLLLAQIVQTPGSTFFFVDVLISAVVLLFFIIQDQKTKKIRGYPIAIAGIFLIGVSFSLPFYLFLKELDLSQNNKIKSI